MTQQFHLWVFVQEAEIKVLASYVHIHVHSSSTHQSINEIQVSTYR